MRRAAAVVLVLSLLAACGTAGGGDDAVTVTATPWPLEWLARRVAPDADVRGLGQSGQDPHELDLRPAEREALERADVILLVGPVGFQPQVEEAASARPGAAVAVTEVAGDLLLHVTEGGDDHAHDHGEEAVDPHLWFDPRTLAEAATALAERLADVDPAGAAAYRTRAEDARAELAALHADVDELLSGCEQDLALVGHEAFAYVLAPRGLEQVGVSGVGGHGEASPARMAELTALIRERGITTVLSEPVEGREAAEALAREAGVALTEVDTLESPAEPARARGYPALLREQARVFAGALECQA